MQAGIRDINMDVYESEKVPLPQLLYYRHPVAETTGMADTAATRVMLGELPSMNWKVPSLSRPPHYQHYQPLQSPIMAPFPATGTSSYHAPASFTGRTALTPSANPTVQVSPAFQLADDSAGSYNSNTSNNRSNRSSSISAGSNVNIPQMTTSNIPSMMPFSVTDTTVNHQSPSLPLPHVAATLGQVGAGVMTASVGAVGIAAVNAAQQQKQQIQPETKTQLPKLKGLSHHCPMCDKSFKRKSWLRRHLLSHSPERHFGCPWCLSKHKRKDNLFQHMKLKHTEVVLEKLRENNVGVAGEIRNDNIRTLLYAGRLNKEDVKKVLNGLIDNCNK